MFQKVLQWFQREDGQDLSEYCLLAALVALVALAIFIHVSGGIENMWNVANTSLGNATTSSSTTGSGNGSQPAHK
jgi:Flp pilus assembly pilin Flp